MKALSIVALLAVPACAISGGPSDVEEQASGTTQYLLIQDFASTDQSGWYDLVRKLNSEFDDVCGDTFCEGDFSNITPLTFSCSVSSKLGSVKDCAWTFAASQAGVDSTSAAISVDAPTYECHVHPKTTAPKLIALLAGSADAIHETLPGTTGSIYDSLSDCFDHPIGSTPVTSTYTAPPTYVEASDYYTTFANQQKWRDAKAALVAGFDRVCGDTFCGSDFSDLWSLQLVCAVTKSSGNVKSCNWIFGGSSTWVKTSGALEQDSRTWACPMTMKGTISQLITTLTAPGTTDAIQRPLPGVTSTAYDALLGCLP
jgi:hypothetical protein